MRYLSDELIPDDYDSGSCHYCGGSTVLAGGIMGTIRDGHYEQLVACESCGAEWYEIWCLTGIRERTLPTTGMALR